MYADFVASFEVEEEPAGTSFVKGGMFDGSTNTSKVHLCSR